MKPYVKLTNPDTCSIVYGLTRDPDHITCPIMMKREKWDSIKHYVRWKKEENQRSGYNYTMGSFKDMFGDIFK